MNLYIKKAFIKARAAFGTTPNGPVGVRMMQDHLFDKATLTDGPPPNDRGCRACGKIGHLVADCPRKKAADNRKKENRENRERLRSERSDRSEMKEMKEVMGPGEERSEESVKSGKRDLHSVLGHGPPTPTSRVLIEP